MKDFKKIGVIGPGNALCNNVLYDFGEKLGAELASHEFYIICGGLGGFMEAVCKGAKQSPCTFKGQTVGILPGEDSKGANPYIDLAIPTAMGIARNVLIIRTADIVIAAGGGAGTLSEMAFSWQLNKKILCITRFEGWAKELAGKNLDGKNSDLFIAVESIKEIMENLKTSI